MLIVLVVLMANQTQGEINMKYYDYIWELFPNYLKLDTELNTTALGWKEGDIFKLVSTEDGTQLLKKIDPVEKFTRGYE